MLIYSLGHLREIFVSTLYSGRLQYGDALILNVDGLVLKDVDPTKVKIDNSHDIFYFLRTIQFMFPEKSESPQPPVFSMNFRFYLQKLSILLTDQKWSSNGPLLEILMGSLLFHGI
ncbi:hypothetical protein Tco_1051253, partial [Tanacetum coccineum]